jgi:hypothetical protein
LRRILRVGKGMVADEMLIMNYSIISILEGKILEANIEVSNQHAI